MEHSERIATIRQKILDEVARIEKEGRHAPMTEVGTALCGFKIKEVAQNLGGFIREHMADDLEILRHKAIPGRDILVKLGTDPGSEWGHAVRPMITNGYYEAAFWAAFAKPIAEGKRRYLFLNPKPHFKEVEPETDPPAGSYEIPPDYAAPADMQPGLERHNLVMSNISRWAATNGIDLDRMKQGQSAPNPSATSIAQIPQQHGMSVTGRQAGPDRKGIGVLALLSETDRSRILVPLDILEKLLRL